MTAGSNLPPTRWFTSAFYREKTLGIRAESPFPSSLPLVRVRWDTETASPSARALTSQVERVGVLVLRHFIRSLAGLHAQELDDVSDSFCNRRSKKKVTLGLVPSFP